MQKVSSFIAGAALDRVFSPKENEKLGSAIVVASVLIGENAEIATREACCCVGGDIDEYRHLVMGADADAKQVFNGHGFSVGIAAQGAVDKSVLIVLKERVADDITDRLVAS